MSAFKQKPFNFEPFLFQRNKAENTSAMFTLYEKKVLAFISKCAEVNCVSNFIVYLIVPLDV